MDQVGFANQSRIKAGEGDWYCPDPMCKNVNFAKREKCNRCGIEKSENGHKKKLGQEIGKVAAEKSRGLFTPEDWQCNKCGNVNWARRLQCNMCNAPKFGEVEERTGYGGGYNERGVVEYIKRDESDDEYDEFGRKKKKKEGSNSKLDGGDDDEHEEEEDDEEDDDDGDLSKYDLSEWGGDDDSGESKQKEKDRVERVNKGGIGDRRERSRSRSPH